MVPPLPTLPFSFRGALWLGRTGDIALMSARTALAAFESFLGYNFSAANMNEWQKVGSQKEAANDRLWVLGAFPKRRF